MDQLNYYLNKDYFKIKTNAGQEKVRKINIYLLGICGVLLVVILFYIILCSSTYYSKLDDLDDYVNEFRKKNLSKFDDINFGVKIMPSFSSEENNILVMKHSNNIDKSKIENGKSIMYSYDLSTTYFRLNHTNNIFPKFKFTKEYVPLGDSILMCLAANWADIEKGKSNGVMKPVQSFPNCSMAISGAIVWNELDPTNGVDIPIWKQYMYEADCSDAECDDYCANYYNGIFVDGVEKHVCYSYEILDSICLVVEYDEKTNDYKYVSGCFDKGKVYKMVPAELNKVYLFKGVEIEIRDRSDPIIKAAEWSNYSFKYGNGFRYIAYLFNLILIAAILALAYVAYMIYTEKQKGANNDPNLLRNESNMNNVDDF